MSYEEEQEMNGAPRVKAPPKVKIPKRNIADQSKKLMMMRQEASRVVKAAN